MPVVAAVDRSARAESVIEHAKRLADDAGLDLHIAHVGEGGVPHPKSGYDSERTRVISEQRATGIAREIGEESLAAGEFDPVGLQGDPAEELLAYAEKRDADYLVVSARKRTPVGQAVFGSVTQSLLLNAECPVVTAPHGTE